MYLDADEVLVEGEGPRLRELLGHTWREGIFLTESNHVGELQDGVAVQHTALRLFRTAPSTASRAASTSSSPTGCPSLPERVEYTQVRVEHFGYLGAVRDAKEKSRRNLELLERQVAEGVDTPFLHFNLGSERAASGDVAGSLAHLERAWEKLADDAERLEYGYFPSLCSRLVKALNANGRHDEAIARADEVLGLLPGFTDVVLRAGAGRPLPPATAETALRPLRALRRDGRRPRALQRDGRRRHLPRPQPAGRDADRRRAASTRPRRSCATCWSTTRTFVGAVEPYARVAAARRHPGRRGRPRASPSWCPSRRRPSASCWPSRSTRRRARRGRGAAARRPRAAQPGAHAARVALAEARLSQRRLAGAAEHAAAVPADAPHAPSAAQTLLFARLAGGAPDADARRRLRLRAPGRPRPGRARRARRVARRGAGRARPSPSPPARPPLVAVMLEALARLERFDEFEALAGVVEKLDLPWREQRELLAGVYFRRGFLESAAREWIGVAERLGAPDERALRGLAGLADAQGLHDDAQLMRDEADGLAGLTAVA